MKKLFTSLLFSFCAVISVFAQQSEGHIVYDLELNTNDTDPEIQMMATMMQGSTLDIYFQNQNSRSEIELGTMMKMVVITNSKSGDVLTLLSGMFGKKAIQSNYNDPELADDKPAYKVEYVNETKVILGYTCKKAVLTSEDGAVLTAWYSEDLSIYKKGINYMDEQIPGAPLEFEMDMNGLKMLVKAKTIEKSLKSKSLFDLTVPEGYTVTSPEELKQFGGQ